MVLNLLSGTTICEFWGYKGDYMLDIQTKLNEIKDKIERNLDYPYLSQYIKKPEIDNDKLLLLLSFLDSLELPSSNKDNYALTTMLLQIALDTHDEVTNAAMDETNQRNIQLTVLAGTYFSGLYYRILAKQNDIDVIRVLSQGVEIINDHKIMFYQKDFDGIDELISSLAKIEASLFKQLANYFRAKQWEDLVSNFCLLRRLISEKEKFSREHPSPLFDVLKTIVFPKNEQSTRDLSLDQKNYLLLICERYIDFSKELLLKAKKNIPFLNAMLDERIQQLLSTHQLVLKSLAEEG